ncbi:hypothetical protein [Rhizobium sp. F40D2]
MEELKAFTDGGHVKVEIVDLEKPMTADLVWNWKKAQSPVRMMSAAKRST